MKYCRKILMITFFVLISGAMHQGLSIAGDKRFSAFTKQMILQKVQENEHPIVLNTPDSEYVGKDARYNKYNLWTHVQSTGKKCRVSVLTKEGQSSHIRYQYVDDNEATKVFESAIKYRLVGDFYLGLLEEEIERKDLQNVFVLQFMREKESGSEQLIGIIHTNFQSGQNGLLNYRTSGSSGFFYRECFLY